jgi:nicotinate phosphoribosyltransferase
MKTDPVKGNIYKVDVTCLRGDELCKKIEAGESFTVCDEYDRYKYKTFEAGEYTAIPLQTKVMEGGKRCAPVHTLAEKKAYYNNTLMHFSPSERRLINPHYYKVDISDDLYNLKMGIINRLVKEINDFKL